jgi:hypothetical protein
MANQSEIMATRTTTDGEQVQFWTDGAVTCGNPRSRMPVFARSLARRLAWLVAGEICISTASELGLLVKAARAAWNAYATHPRYAGAPMPDDAEIRRVMRAKFEAAAFKASRGRSIADDL